MKKRFVVGGIAFLGSFLFCSCTVQRPIDNIAAARDLVVFDADNLGIKQNSTVRITIRSGNKFVQQVAQKLEKTFSNHNIKVIKSGMPDYWLLLSGSYDHCSDTEKTAYLNRHVYVKDTGFRQAVQFRVRNVGMDLISSEDTCQRHNVERRPRIFYRNASYSGTGMVCGITLYRTRDLNMLSSMHNERKVRRSKITAPETFHSSFADDACDFVAQQVISSR